MKTTNTIRPLHLKVLFFLLPVAGVVSGILPFLGAYITNKLISSLPGYALKVEKAGLSWLGKSICIKEIVIDQKKETEGGMVRLFSAQQIMLIINRSALLKGLLVFDLAIDAPSVVYPKGMEFTSTGNSPEIQIPVVCTNALISNGSVRFIDTTTSPTVELSISKLDITARNLSNTPHPDSILPSEVSIAGELYDGLFTAAITADVAQAQPRFDLNAEIKHIQLDQLNDFFKAYGNFDVNRGTLSLFAEAAASDNKFKGYVKPEIFDLDILGPEDKNKSFVNKLWQSLLGTAAQLLENQHHDELATKIPFSGTFKNPKINLWFAGVEVLSNVFIRALQPSIDYQIDINSPAKK